MKLFIILVLTLFALFGLASAGKAEDYKAYKDAEVVAKKKADSCGKYLKGDCASITECEQCSVCLSEAVSLYQGVVQMRRDYTKNYFDGVKEPGHDTWEKGLTADNNNRTRVAGVCRGKKKQIELTEKRKQNNAVAGGGTAVTRSAMGRSASSGSSAAKSPTTLAKGRSSTAPRSSAKSSGMPTSPRKGLGRRP
ncbi:hypothetical protein GQ42DRAFT_156600 [Ramicandelaber brevisporus]|nr:hypothetical protein GQ42DRAFT_156600 [Ramicandelaber brevisporus]